MAMHAAVARLVFLEAEEGSASFDKRSGRVSVDDDGVLWVEILW